MPTNGQRGGSGDYGHKGMGRALHEIHHKKGGQRRVLKRETGANDRSANPGPELGARKGKVIKKLTQGGWKGAIAEGSCLTPERRKIFRL